MDEKTRVSVKANVQVALKALGLPVHSDENFKDTAARWVGLMEAFTQEYSPAEDLGTTFPLKGASEDIYDSSMIAQVGIPYRALCAHHLLPVLGTAHVGYIPKDRVVGLSKLARLVYGLSHRMPSLQEDVCHAVTAHLLHNLKPIGAICVISAEHGCMAARGVEEATGCIRTVTSSINGVFANKPEAREEFYRLISLGV